MNKIAKIKTKNNFLTDGKFSPKEYNQTDFGGFYFNLPKETVFPKSSEELAMTLKRYNSAGRKVTIRNTGHSVNGQTLTADVEVNVGEIKKTEFDEKKLTITVGCGTSWHELLQAIGFPKYCPPVFPSNPNQEIKVGGSASVGGVGYYSSKYGGLWNHVLALKLVTMTGEIIACSRDKHPDYFKFALGGFGRIGVISELTLSVLPSKKDVLGMMVYYHSEAKYDQYFKKAISDPFFDGVLTCQQINTSSWYGKFFGLFKNLQLIMDVSPREDIAKKIEYVKRNYHVRLPFYFNGLNKNLDLSLHSQRCAKKEVVYFYPNDYKHNQLDRTHPWGDYLVSTTHYLCFIQEVVKIANHYDLAKYSARESIFNGRATADAFGSYAIKKITLNDNDLPLSLDLPGEQFSMMLSLLPTVPILELNKAIKMSKEITDLTFDLGGKRYLYGLHSLSKKQVEIQFGRKTIHEWQLIKDRLDPKHLLNIGVIEHLD